jgi:hypothetical protein
MKISILSKLAGIEGIQNDLKGLRYTVSNRSNAESIFSKKTEKPKVRFERNK